MTDLERLARLQAERERPLARWNVPGPQRDRVQPRQENA
jgi:hypothetical protein